MNAHKAVVGLALCLAVLTGCQGASNAAEATEAVPTAPTPEPWHVVLTSETEMLTTLGGFFGPQNGVTIGDDRQVHSSSDGGATWVKSQISSTGLFGLDFLDEETVWACGYRNVKLSHDGGKTWDGGADFGSSMPEHCRFLSLTEDGNAWAATQTEFGVTTDGAAAWTNSALPEKSGKISAIDLFGIGQGYLLDVTGQLFLTLDNAITWSRSGVLPLDGEVIASLNAPSAAMGWQDAENGLVVVASIVDGTAGVTVYRTADGGKNWRTEKLAVPYGSPVVTQDGRFVSIFTQPNKITLLEFPTE